jgi:hypothetical protein
MKLLRVRFTVRLMLAGIAAFGIWLGLQINSARRQNSAISAITVVDGYYYYDFQFVDGEYSQDEYPAGPDWLWRHVDLSYICNVTAVGLNCKPATDGTLEQLASLRQLEVLDLTGSKITDKGLEHLRAMKKLRYLRLDRTETTDAGLVHLQELEQLQDLLLIDTRVTDGGVAELRRRLPKLNIVR